MLPDATHDGSFDLNRITWLAQKLAELMRATSSPPAGRAGQMLANALKRTACELWIALDYKQAIPAKLPNHIERFARMSMNQRGDVITPVYLRQLWDVYWNVVSPALKDDAAFPEVPRFAPLEVDQIQGIADRLNAIFGKAAQTGVGAAQKEIKRALSCLRGLFLRWDDFNSRYGEKIKALDDYGIQTPSIIIGANGEGACLAQDTRLSLAALYDHGSIPHSLRGCTLEDAIAKFPAWPTGVISAAKNKAFVENLPVQLDWLAQIYVELGECESQFERFPRSMISEFAKEVREQSEPTEPLRMIYARDCAGIAFQFNAKDPTVKKWRSGERDLYLVRSQWYHLDNSPYPLPAIGAVHWATYFTREQARDWFLGNNPFITPLPANILPDELADLTPTNEPTSIELKQPTGAGAKPTEPGIDLPAKPLAPTGKPTESQTKPRADQAWAKDRTMSDVADAIDGLIDPIDMYLQVQKNASAWLARTGKPVEEYERHLVALREQVRILGDVLPLTHDIGLGLVQLAIDCVSENQNAAAAAIKRWPETRTKLEALANRERANPAAFGSTLGWLISQLERCEQLKLLFRPDPATMPGIDRIEHLCDAQFNGTGLTAANVRQLRAQVCKKLKWNSEQAKCANGLTFTNVADVLDGVLRIPTATADDERRAIEFLNVIGEKIKQANQAVTTPAASSEGEAKPLTGAERAKAFQSLEPAVQKAYLAFQYAESKEESRLQDAEAHKFLDEEGISADQGNRGDLIDYKLPNLDTWSRQLREARKALREQKNKRRGRARTTRSIVKGGQIENQNGKNE